MGVPPPSQPSGSQPSGSDDRGPSQSKRSKRDFNLPGKNKKGEDGEKKKSLFDLAGGEGVKELKQQIEQEQKAGMETTSSVQASEAKASVQAVGKLIQNLVADMKIGQVDGKDFASMNLSDSSEIPEAFAGSNLTLSYEANSLVIRFDNFMTPQQENNAITLVEKNKEQLEQMVQALQSKNINVQEMTIGNHTINLPRAEPLPPPFQAPEAGSAETKRERDQGEGGKEEGGGPE